MATIILIGGLSKRMGRDKATINYGDSTLTQILVSRFNAESGNVIVVARENQELVVDHAIIVRDLYAGKGPLGGLHAGLLASQDEWNFVLACDMPFADPKVAHALLDRCNGYDAVIPMLKDRPEPLCAAYNKSCITYIEENITNDILKMRKLLDQIKTLYVTENELIAVDNDLSSFTNINTPEEFARLSLLEMMR